MLARDEDARLEKTASVAPVSPLNPSARIAALNDALRRHGTGGRLLLTPGVVRLGDIAVRAAVDAVAVFTAFSADNDPYGEHDFGSFDHAGSRLYWKIDYYDRDLQFGSPDPSDPAVTTRVLTVMLADEY